MNRERYDWLWRRGSREAVSAALEKLEDRRERGEVYVRAIEVTQRWRPALARFLCEAYLEEFYRDPAAFGEGILPHGEVLRALTRIYEQDGQLELAEWACGIALTNGITVAGLDGGFERWRQKICDKRAIAAAAD